MIQVELPANREKYREFCQSLTRKIASRKRVTCTIRWRNSPAGLKSEQGTIREGTGNFDPGSGNLGKNSLSPHFLFEQQRIVKAGGRLVKHARYYRLLLAEGHLNRRRFGAMLGRMAMLQVPAG